MEDQKDDQQAEMRQRRYGLAPMMLVVLVAAVLSLFLGLGIQEMSGNGRIIGWIVFGAVVIAFALIVVAMSRQDARDEQKDTDEFPPFLFTRIILIFFMISLSVAVVTGRPNISLNSGGGSSSIQFPLSPKNEAAQKQFDLLKAVASGKSEVNEDQVDVIRAEAKWSTHNEDIEMNYTFVSPQPNHTRFFAAIALVAVSLLWLVLRDSRKKTPFTKANVLRVRIAAIVTFVIVVFGGSIKNQYSMAAFVSALFLFFLAEVIRRGNTLYENEELTV